MKKNMKRKLNILIDRYLCMYLLSFLLLILITSTTIFDDFI